MSENTGKKVLVLIDQMAVGGAARVCSTLLFGLNKMKYELTLVLDYATAAPIYDIPKDIRKINMPFKAKGVPVVKQIRLIYDLHRYVRINKPDVIIAVTFFPFFYAFFSSLGLKVPIVAYDHTSFGRDMGYFNNWIRYYLYGKAEKLVLLTEKDRRILGLKFPNKTVIYNPLTYPVVDVRTQRTKTILCAGRLDAWKVKGFDRMIDVWSSISKNFPEWKLLIAGAGSPESLKAMALGAGVEGSVDFLGHVSDMEKLYQESAIFALPSRVEGFPMVLLEAMSQGCICCSFSMDGAVNEMMSDSSGCIVKDNDTIAFGNALIGLMDKYPDYDEMRKSAYTDASRFDTETYFEHWGVVLKGVIR